jgi:hypothetical protein
VRIDAELHRDDTGLGLADPLVLDSETTIQPGRPPSPSGLVVAFHTPPASMAREPPLPNCGFDHIAQRPVHD